MLTAKYGNKWEFRRKQTPYEWKVAMAESATGAVGACLKRKGRVAFSELPGKHGEAARRITDKVAEGEELGVPDLHATLERAIADENFKLLYGGLQALPHKSSVGWVYSVKSKLGFRRQVVSTTEPEDVKPKDEADFKDQVNDLITKKEIPADMWVHSSPIKLITN